MTYLLLYLSLYVCVCVRVCVCARACRILIFEPEGYQTGCRKFWGLNWGMMDINLHCPCFHKGSLVTVPGAPGSKILLYVLKRPASRLLTGEKQCPAT